MALRIKKFFSDHGYDLLMSLLITIVLMFPYLFRGFTAVEHDTFFHLSRIEHLAECIGAGEFLPAMYMSENYGFGYPSPLFYSDFFLIPSAILRLAGVPLAMCCRITVIIASYLSAFFMMKLAERITGKKEAGLIAASAYLFSNYHITDIYVRGALGEIFALAVFPALLNSLYGILHEKNEEEWFALALSLAAMILSHNLSFVLAVMVCIIFFIAFLDRMEKKIFLALCKGAGFAFLITAFYTLPMIEQLRNQTLVVNYFASSSSLESYSIDPWQYFANRTVFALAGNERAHDDTMLVNAGYFLQFVPLLYLLVKKEKKNRFADVCFYAGYVMILLPCSLIPWKYLVILRILQFPWRLNTAGIALLSIPASIAVTELLKKKVLVYACALVLSAECIWHVRPALYRSFGLSDSQTWQDVLDGNLCDPCNSADYVRVELAAGDYLPWPHPDYRTQSREILNENREETGIEYNRSPRWFSFSLEEDPESDLILPLTWYKGWAVYRTDSAMERFQIRKSDEGLVQIYDPEPGRYIVLFEDTPLRNLNRSLSIISLVFMVLIKNKMNWVSGYLDALKKTKRS